MLPTSLKIELEEEARRERLSFGALVRRALEKFVVSMRSHATSDSFLSSNTLFHDSGPTDVAEKHDEHLYTKAPH